VKMNKKELNLQYCIDWHAKKWW